MLWYLKKTAELVGNWFNSIIIVMLLLGGILIHFSFDWDNNQIIYPAMNLIGILLLALIPWLMGVSLLVGRQLGKIKADGYKIHVSSVCSCCLGIPIAFFCPAGYLTGDNLVWIALAAVTVLGFFEMFKVGQSKTTCS